MRIFRHLSPKLAGRPIAHKLQNTRHTSCLFVFRAGLIIRIGKLFLPLLDLPMRSTRMVPDRRMIWGGQDPAGYSLYTIEELCFLLEPLRLRGTVRDRSGASFRGGGAKTAQGSATEHTVECGMKGSTGSAERCGPNAEGCGRMGKYQEVQGFWDYLRLLRSPPKNSENARLFGRSARLVYFSLDDTFGDSGSLEE